MSLRSLFSRRNQKSPPSEPGEFVLPSDVPPVEQFIAALGLLPDNLCMRDHPRWRSPRKVLVSAGTPRLLAWLGEIAPGVALVPFELEADGLREVEDADAVIGWFSPAMIERGQALSWLQVHTAGVENALRVPAIGARGIVVTNLKRVAGPVVAEHVFAMLLSLARRLGPLHERQQERRWAQFEVPESSFHTLRGRSLVVVGLGGIGSEVARLGHAFGLTVGAVRASGTDAPAFVQAVTPVGRMFEALATADIVVNALPATPKTLRLFDAAAFRSMRPGAIFVNVARGLSVVTDDLVGALSSGHLAAAALDVTDPEPLPASHPLWSMPNVLITPHVAGMNGDTTSNGWRVMRENLRRFVAGDTLLSVVDFNRGY